MEMQASVAERRSSSHSQLKTLLETRTETLSLYSQLANMRPFEADREMQLMVQEFCEARIDEDSRKPRTLRPLIHGHFVVHHPAGVRRFYL